MVRSHPSPCWGLALKDEHERQVEALPIFNACLFCLGRDCSQNPTNHHGSLAQSQPAGHFEAQLTSAAGGH